MGWSCSNDKKQESTWSYLRAWSAESKLISVPTALYLHRAQVWMNQHSWVTLTPSSQLLPDKAAPSVLLCSGETWPSSPKVSLHVCCQPFIPFANYSMRCIYKLQLWIIITGILFRGARGRWWLIQFQCVCHFSANEELSNILSHLNLMPIMQNKYSHSHFIGEKTEIGGQLTICPKSHSKWQGQNFNLDPLTIWHCPEERNSEIQVNNGANRQRGIHWNGEGPCDSSKIISRKNEDKLELSSLLIIHLPVICHWEKTNT